MPIIDWISARGSAISGWFSSRWPAAIIKTVADNADAVGKIVSVISIVIAAGLWILETPDRAEQRHNAAWPLIAVAHQKPGEFGRKSALESLNRDGVSLSEIDLSDAVLPNLSLPSADLSNAIFKRTNILNVDFTCHGLTKFLSSLPIIGSRCSADLQSAVFDNAQIGQAAMPGAFMSKTQFLNMRLFDADFQGAELIKADFNHVQFACGNFTKSIWQRVTLEESRFEVCYAGSSLSRPPDFGGAFFIQTDLRNTNIVSDWLKRSVLCDSYGPDGTYYKTDAPGCERTPMLLDLD